MRRQLLVPRQSVRPENLNLAEGVNDQPQGGIDHRVRDVRSNINEQRAERLVAVRHSVSHAQHLHRKRRDRCGECDARYFDSSLFPAFRHRIIGHAGIMNRRARA